MRVREAAHDAPLIVQFALKQNARKQAASKHTIGIHNDAIRQFDKFQLNENGAKKSERPFDSPANRRALPKCSYVLS